MCIILLFLIENEYLGVDITDYFNYGFNEDTWRNYFAKQVQMRLEQSMQSRVSCSRYVDSSLYAYLLGLQC